MQCEEEDQVGLFLFSSNSDDVHASFCSDSVRGRLYRCSTYWRDTLNASQFVQSIVQDGYKIPFRSIPETCFLANNKSARDNPDFVSEAIVKLLKGRYIEEQSEPPYCVNPLSVAKGKKLRLVLDLRNITVNVQASICSSNHYDMRILDHYLNYLNRTFGFSHGILNPAIIMLTFMSHTENF